MELPAAFAHRTARLLGEDAYQRLAEALQGEAPVSLRLNPLRRAVRPGAAAALSLVVPWAGEGRYLDRRPAFTFDPLLHAGCYYVQEASSMFLEQALRQYMPSHPVVALDLCAAPGGKSTHLRSLLPDSCLLVANEVVRNRCQVLAENLCKWGHPGVVVTNNDPADFAPLASFFDLMVVDAPCSGEGMFRKDPGAVAEWSEQNVELCRARQWRILSDVWPCLKPGGLLVYSTCTYNTEENEENVRRMRDEWGAEVLPLDIPADWNVTGNLLDGESFLIYRFLPHLTRGEGFCLAVLRKPMEETDAPAALPKASRRRAGKERTPQVMPKAMQDKARTWLACPDDYELTATATELTAFPHAHQSALEALRACLRILYYGCPLAESKGRDLLPLHSLALSAALRPDAFPSEEVAYPQAVAYLRKEAVTLSPSAPKGIVLLTYRSVPLGFVKNVGNRANNLYPSEWRIRSGYVPDEAVTVLPVG